MYWAQSHTQAAAAELLLQIACSGDGNVRAVGSDDSTRGSGLRASVSPLSAWQPLLLTGPDSRGPYPMETQVLQGTIQLLVLPSCLPSMVFKHTRMSNTEVTLLWASTLWHECIALVVSVLKQSFPYQDLT